MKCHERELGDEELSAFIARVARGACAVAPALGQERAQSLIDLVLRTRLRKCAVCAQGADCGCVRPGRHLHDDARELANICAINAADLVGEAGTRANLETRLASALYDVFSQVIRDGKECNGYRAASRGR